MDADALKQNITAAIQGDLTTLVRVFAHYDEQIAMLAGVAGGAAGMTAAEVRDIVATFVMEGENVAIVHQDSDDKLVINAATQSGRRSS